MKNILSLLIPLSLICSPIVAKEDSPHPFSQFADRSIPSDITFFQEPCEQFTKNGITFSLYFGSLNKKDSQCLGLFIKTDNPEEEAYPLYLSGDEEATPTPILFSDIMNTIEMVIDTHKLTFNREDRLVYILTHRIEKDGKRKQFYFVFDKDHVAIFNVTLTPDGNGGNYFQVSFNKYI
ncbi:hypothetical protein K0U07_01705 [bacterium]|nr:hypothetical protein [bacterium]